jgi:hypothetical protein
VVDRLFLAIGELAGDEVMTYVLRVTTWTYLG